MEPSYLSLGDMLTFIGLLVAVVQLVKPRYVLTWKLSSPMLRWIGVMLLAAGYFSPLVSIVTPSTPGLNIFWMTISLGEWLQIVGFLLITLGALIIAYLYTKWSRSRLLTPITKYRHFISKFPPKDWKNFQLHLERNKSISTKSAKKFYEITSEYLVRGNINEVVEIVHYNLHLLVRAAMQCQPERFRVGDENANKPDGSNYAFEIMLQLLTDETVMKHVCTANRPFLHSIVWEETQQTNWGISEFANVLYENLFQSLASNADSFFYTQKDINDGSARFGNVYELLTQEKITTRLSIIPSLLTWEVKKYDVQLDLYAEVLLKLLDSMIESYKKKPGSQPLLDNIRRLLDEIIGNSGLIGGMAYDSKARKRYADDRINSVEAKIISELHLALETRLMFKSDDPQIFTTNDKEPKATNSRAAYEQTTLTGLMAHFMFELIQSLASFYSDTEDPDEPLRMQAFSFIYIDVNTGVALHYKELLWELLFDKSIDGKIEKYRTNFAGYYPVVFRFIVDYLTPFTTPIDAADNAAINRLKNIMANELTKALLAGKTMHGNDFLMKDELLPKSVEAVIQPRKKTVTYYSVNRRGRKTLIDLSIKPVVTVTP